ncbi:hypothetical protein Ssi02_57300 [Sinosporangium siamense]|uniref:Uncharacterized protein n=1 Tax=Sinosporangium siamense TaxID=1367973 RepID=A0A919RNZ2_9ACTN|nr:hypothetical protein Ssi02_57300 [Sinosporangium siamense]
MLVVLSASDAQCRWCSLPVVLSASGALCRWCSVLVVPCRQWCTVQVVLMQVVLMRVVPGRVGSAVPDPTQVVPRVWAGWLCRNEVAWPAPPYRRGAQRD